MVTLDDFNKVKHLADLYRALDYYSEKFDEVAQEIRVLASNMSAKDIKYAIKESEK